MAASQGVIGYGTLVKRGDGGSPEVFTTIAEVIEVGTPEQETSDIEFTHMESPNSFKEYKPGLKEPGEVSMKCNAVLTNSTQNATTGIIADQLNGTTRNWKIVFPDLTTCSFSGYVKKVKVEPPINDRETLSFTIKISGPATWS